MNSWIAENKIPSYLNIARMIPLSKEATAYPEVGNIRTIAVLPAISKIWEKILLKRL